MLRTPKVERAFGVATKWHDGQYRKGAEKLPAITHLAAVASIASRHTNDEDIIIAALLHDTLEDTDYPIEELEKEFGKRVAGIVLGVTIPEAHEVEGHTWTNDRTRYFENLRDNAPRESFIVAAADKINNFSSILEEYGDRPCDFQEDFGGSVEDRLHVYGAIVDLIYKRAPKALAEELLAVWKEYRDFVVSLEK